MDETELLQKVISYTSNACFKNFELAENSYKVGTYVVLVHDVLYVLKFSDLTHLQNIIYKLKREKKKVSLVCMPRDDIQEFQRQMLSAGKNYPELRQLNFALLRVC